MACFKKQEGFTLVEVVVAIAILAIIIFAFTTLYTTSFSGIFDAGRKSEALFEAQEEMDYKISEGLSGGPEKTFTIEFYKLDQKITIDVEGEEKHYHYTHGEDRSGDLYYLFPAD